MKSPDKFDKNSKYSSVFLSHSSEDVEFVEKLIERFEQLEIKFWLDNHELKIGDSLFTEIGSAISEANFVAVVLSNNSINSEWVKIELQYAQSREIKEKRVVVLPILIEDVQIPHFLNYKVHADFTSHAKFEESFQKLLRTLLIEEVKKPPSEKFYPNEFIPELEYFVGRTKLLEDLKNQLKITHRASIHDISGLGKTFTTYKFADENQDDYEKIFFVRANKEEMMQSLAEIGVLLNPSLREEQDQSKQAQGFKNWLEKNDNWLVIYDNVDEPVKLFPFVPLNKNGDCIFTSNFALITNLGDEIKINKLDKEDAESLLYSRRYNKPHLEIVFEDAEEQEAFENIVQEIDGLPISLNTTGAFINKNTISFAEFERKMNRTPEILVKNEDDFDYYQNKSALKAFSIAIDDIINKKDDDEFENSPELAQKLLFAAGFIAPDNIPEIFLQKILQKITEIDFQSEDSEDLWQEIRRKLFEYDLLKYDNKVFRTHRLIQKVIQIKQNVEEQILIIPTVLKTIDDLFPWSEYGNWEECDLYVSQSISAIKFVENLKISSNEIARNFNKIGRHSRERVQFQSAVEYINKAINEYQKLFGKENTNTASCLSELAMVYRSQDKYSKAIELYKQALTIDEKTIGKGHPDYGTCLNNLANVFLLQDRYDEAIEKYEEALVIAEKTGGKEHSSYAIRLCNLAKIYIRQKDFKQAKKNNLQALKILEKSVGKFHPYYAACLSDLALVYKSQDNYEDAIKLYKQALEISEKTIGREHPNYAISLNNLAIVYYSQEKYEKALCIFEKALGINEKILPKNHPSTLQGKRNVTRCREKLEKK